MAPLNHGALRLAGRRLLQLIPALLLATLLAFALLKLVPGDIAVTLAGDNASDQRIQEIRQLYGLDRSILVQYVEWLGKVVRGDLSHSLLTGEAVLVAIERCLPSTLLIVVLAMGMTVLIGAPLGVLAAHRQGGWVDTAVMTVSSLGVAIPSFWLAMLLISTLAMDRSLFPVSGAVPLLQDPWAALHHAVLPALALAAGGIAEVSRQLRGALLELLSSQQVRTLRAKGLAPGAILWKHGLRNVGVNLLTVIALLANRMLAATVVIEAVFAIPGMGGLIVNAALQRDFPVVQGVILVMVVLVLLVNLVTDMLYGLIDPRLR
jgi:peptide/nickel transport system permease protein